MSAGPWPRRLRVLLRLGVAAAVLVVLVRLVDPRTLVDRLAHVHPAELVLALAATLLAYAVGSERLAMLARARGLPARRGEVLGFTLAGAFYGLFLPGGNAAGLVVRLWRLAGAERRFGQAAAALVVDRLVATVTLAAFGLALWAADRPRAPLAAGVVLAVALAALVLGWAAFANRFTAGVLARVRDMPVVGKAVRSALAAGEGLAGLGAGRALALLLLSVTAHLAGIAAWIAVARGVELPLDGLTIAWLRCAVVTVTLLPVSLAGLGLREGAVLVLLRPLGVPDDASLAFSLLVSTVTVLGVGVVGGVLEAAQIVRRPPAPPDPA